MNVDDFLDMAYSIHDKHGFGHVPIELNRSKTTLGFTQFKRPSPFSSWELNKFVYSKPFILVLARPEIRDTVLHEVAHAITGPDAGHNILWRNVARQVGAKPKACADASLALPYVWIGTCPNGHERGFHRAPRVPRSCGKCLPGRFSQDFLFQWTKDGQRVALSDMPKQYQDRMK